jgi:hypothetical protein
MAELRKCIGSAKFGIEAHEAPVGEFPSQPSQKDGLGRMCKPHWNQYTTALRKAAPTAKTEDGATTPEPIETKARRAKDKVEEESPRLQGPAAGRSREAALLRASPRGELVTTRSPRKWFTPSTRPGCRPQASGGSPRPLWAPLHVLIQAPAAAERCPEGAGATPGIVGATGVTNFHACPPAGPPFGVADRAPTVLADGPESK